MCVTRECRKGLGCLEQKRCKQPQGPADCTVSHMMIFLEGTGKSNAEYQLSEMHIIWETLHLPDFKSKINFANKKRYTCTHSQTLLCSQELENSCYYNSNWGEYSNGRMAVLIAENPKGNYPPQYELGVVGQREQLLHRQAICTMLILPRNKQICNWHYKKDTRTLVSP